jgi:transcriptional regulator with XRE-family HTH domain
MPENHSLTGDALRNWRETHGLSQDEMGDLLGKSREWIGKLERGEREISDRIFLRFEKVRREPRFLDKSEPELSQHVAEAPGSYGTPDMLRAEIRRLLGSTINLAGDDVGKLGWVREQLLRHVTAPAHWGLHEQVLRGVLEEEKAAAKAAEHHSPKERKA